jgi:hypothetical protein
LAVAVLSAPELWMMILKMTVRTPASHTYFHPTTMKSLAVWEAVMVVLLPTQRKASRVEVLHLPRMQEEECSSIIMFVVEEPPPK